MAGTVAAQWVVFAFTVCLRNNGFHQIYFLLPYISRQGRYQDSFFSEGERVTPEIIMHKRQGQTVHRIEAIKVEKKRGRKERHEQKQSQIERDKNIRISVFHFNPRHFVCSTDTRAPRDKSTYLKKSLLHYFSLPKERYKERERERESWQE